MSRPFTAHSIERSNEKQFGHKDTKPQRRFEQQNPLRAFVTLWQNLFFVLDQRGTEIDDAPRVSLSPSAFKPVITAVQNTKSMINASFFMSVSFARLRGRACLTFPIRTTCKIEDATSVPN